MLRPPGDPRAHETNAHCHPIDVPHPRIGRTPASAPAGASGHHSRFRAGTIARVAEHSSGESWAEAWIVAKAIAADEPGG
jgi:hypothetical protein